MQMQLPIISAHLMVLLAYQARIVKSCLQDGTTKSFGVNHFRKVFRYFISRFLFVVEEMQLSCQKLHSYMESLEKCITFATFIPSP